MVERTFVSGEPSEELLPHFAEDDLTSAEDVEVGAVLDVGARGGSAAREIISAGAESGVQRGLDLVAVAGVVPAPGPTEPVDVLVEPDPRTGHPVVPLGTDGHREGHAEAEDDAQDEVGPVDARERVDLERREGQVVVVRVGEGGDHAEQPVGVGLEVRRAVEHALFVRRELEERRPGEEDTGEDEADADGCCITKLVDHCPASGFCHFVRDSRISDSSLSRLLSHSFN